ncbi:MAG: hypothetical protein S0880_24080 [Actinomycetota bacterium]|nr:hypothetical protein [Actinomycetota bacterium]
MDKHSDNGTHHAPERMAFISHKHADKDLAEVVGRFIRLLSGGNVRIYLSGHAAYEGPRFSQPIPDELRSALARAGLVLLIYTDPDDDWDWCMWECGVATDPNDDTATKVGVLSFGETVPSPYASSLNLMVDLHDEAPARSNRDILTQFAIEFCHDRHFWPDDLGAVSPRFTTTEIENMVTAFLEELSAVELRRHDANKSRVLDALALNNRGGRLRYS